MYIAEICSGTKSHARTAIEIIPPESQSESDLQNGRWLIEDLQDDEDYTVRVKTVLNGKTICMTCQTILQDEDGIFDRLAASVPDKDSYVEPVSLNLDTETVWTVDKELYFPRARDKYKGQFY